MAPKTPAQPISESVLITGFNSIADRNNMPKRQASSKRRAPTDENDYSSDDPIEVANGSDGDYEPERDMETGTKNNGKARDTSVATTASASSTKRGRPPGSGTGKGRASVSSKKQTRDLSHEELCNKVKDLQAQLKSSKEKKKHEVGVKGKKQDQIDRQKGDIEKLRIRITRLEGDKHDLQQEVQQWKDKCKAIRESNKETDAKIEALQEESFKLLNKGHFPVQPDNDVIMLLSGLLKDVSQWAKKWSVADWKNISPETAEVLWDALSGGKRVGFASERLREALLKGSVPIRVIVNAIINRIVFHNTLMHPFKALKISRGRYNASAGDRFKWLVGVAGTKSFADGQHLRASIVQAVFRFNDKSSKKWTKPPQIHVEGLVLEHSQYILHRVLAAIDVLLSTVDQAKEEQRTEELAGFVSRLVEGSLNLQAQLPRTVSAFLPDLTQLRFELSHDSFIPHRGLKLERQDEAALASRTDLDGRPIDLVVEPLIVRLGDAMGEDYDIAKNLIKGVVWMVKQEDLTQDSLVGIGLKAGVVVAAQEQVPSQPAPQEDQMRRINETTAPAVMDQTTERGGKSSTSSGNEGKDASTAISIADDDLEEQTTAKDHNTSLKSPEPQQEAPTGRVVDNSSDDPPSTTAKTTHMPVKAVTENSATTQAAKESEAKGNKRKGDELAHPAKKPRVSEETSQQPSAPPVSPISPEPEEKAKEQNEHPTLADTLRSRYDSSSESEKHIQITAEAESKREKVAAKKHQAEKEDDKAVEGGPVKIEVLIPSKGAPRRSKQEIKDARERYNRMQPELESRSVKLMLEERLIERGDYEAGRVDEDGW